MLTEAATNGCMHACWRLARQFERGIDGDIDVDGEDITVETLEKNEAQAAKWYRRMFECTERQELALSSTLKQEALDWLRQYDEAQAAAAGGGAAAE